MNLPFTPEEFLAAFAIYNEAVWPMQVVLYAAALVCVGLLFRPGTQASRVSWLVLAFLWAWMGIAYHFIFFSNINPAAWGFGAVFLLSGVVFAWYGVSRTKVSFLPVRGARAAAGAGMIAYALILYPLLGYLAGHRYPGAPTFGLPCPTTIFTLGLLHFSVWPEARWVFVVPLSWAAVGSLAAFQLGIYEDLGLLAAGIVTAATLWPAARRR